MMPDMEEWISIPGFADPMASISHLVGAILFANAGLALLWRAAHRQRTFWFSMQFLLATLFCLSMSFVYHLLTLGSTARAVMLRLDVAAIFVLIASTFTVIHGILFRGWKRWTVPAVLWIVAATGISLRMVFFESVSHVGGNLIFLVMGWLGAVSAWLVYKHFGWRMLAPIVLGGVFYSIGAIINAVNWPIFIPRIWGPHETFHLFVLAGLAAHWTLVWRIAKNTSPNSQLSVA